jgi:hypothetical protein
MKKALLLSVALSWFTPGHPAFAVAQCSLTPVVPQTGKFSIGTATVSLGEADSANQPTAWQGPLRTDRCSFDIGIIEQPIALTPNGQLYVSTYSGSQRSIALYDLKTCTVRWKSPTFAGKLKLTSKSLRMADKTLSLNDDCVPRGRSKRR